MFYLLSGISERDISLLEKKVLEAKLSGSLEAIQKAEKNLELGKTALVTQKHERNNTLIASVAFLMLVLVYCLKGKK
jgi:hypothetical protein